MTKYYNTYWTEYTEEFFCKEEIERRIKMWDLFNEKQYYNNIQPLINLTDY